VPLSPPDVSRPFGLRPWLDQVEAAGQLLRVAGADWDLEIGGVTEVVSAAHDEPPAILFDDITGYPSGFRVVSNLVDTPFRLALTLGLDTDMGPMEFVQALRRRQVDLVGMPPEEADLDLHFPNKDFGEAIDLTKFPVPRWHEQDGGRYIGTACMVITEDPRGGGWAATNAGTYRVMLHGDKQMASFISPGKGGRRHRDQYFREKRNCPVVLVAGQDPLLFVAASSDVPIGMSELEYAGGLHGRPIDVVRGPVTGLPIPADAEIAIEGEILHDAAAAEGPFGEWTGYYASGVREEPVIQVTSVLYKDDPIICGAPPMPPSAGKGNLRNSLIRSANIWNALESAGVPGVTAVWMPTAAGRFMTIVAIDQQYPRHAKQAAAIASQCRAAAYLGRYVVVVDDDVDVLNLEDVLWAVCTRTDPAESIDFLRECWSGPLDPIIPRSRKGLSSRALIDATRPYLWRSEFPAVSGVSSELRQRVHEKWPELARARGGALAGDGTP
jgi:UbiD family decarboxylase